eukprot:3869574-Rhodomonas_salina.5
MRPDPWSKPLERNSRCDCRWLTSSRKEGEAGMRGGEMERDRAIEEEEIKRERHGLETMPPNGGKVTLFRHSVRRILTWGVLLLLCRCDAVALPAPESDLEWVCTLAGYGEHRGWSGLPPHRCRPTAPLDPQAVGDLQL